VTGFFAWAYRHAIGRLVDIEPLHGAPHIEALVSRTSKPTITQHLTAIRMCFD
jgi:hypothetical protein